MMREERDYFAGVNRGDFVKEVTLKLDFEGKIEFGNLNRGGTKSTPEKART